MQFSETWWMLPGIGISDATGEPKTQTRRVLDDEHDARYEAGRIVAIEGMYGDGTPFTLYSLGRKLAQPKRGLPALYKWHESRYIHSGFHAPGENATYYDLARDWWQACGDCDYRVYLIDAGFIERRINIAAIEIDPDVRRISTQDARAEGFGSPFEYLQVWTKMHARTKGIYPCLKNTPESQVQELRAAGDEWARLLTPEQSDAISRIEKHRAWKFTLEDGNG